MANEIFLGDENITNVKLGNLDVKLYLGDKKIYPITENNTQ